ncbi:hypothetical protein MRB53_008112 [Persea americana]|uniref:Uncharacterized protein n=1 Tax=Persea americana TaxID=3435 RepID=A0ACC2MM07_PERAE|nr:hypothetical protein MRB53_008112 [Persea americana]
MRSVSQTYKLLSVPKEKIKRRHLYEEVFGFKLLDAKTFPSLHAWGDRFLNVPFIKEKLPPSDKLLVIFTNIRKGWLNK